MESDSDQSNSLFFSFRMAHFKNSHFYNRMAKPLKRPKQMNQVSIMSNFKKKKRNHLQNSENTVE